jgi:DNA primase
MGIARQSIEDLKKRSKISDFILATTSGKLRGTKGMALCPFHGEKTASMSFTDVENLFHCFGCKEGGDIFKYVQEINNLEFQDAIEFVAEKYGFKLTYTQTSDNSDFKVYQEKIDLINNYFLETMKSNISKDAKAYLQKRKYDNIDIEKYSISFISKDEESFNKFCKTNEITKDDLQRLGFISSNGNMLFKNRIMFPILSFRNNIIAFGGRAIDDFGPKYLNSSDSVLYKKNRNLYFTNEFITATKKKGYAFIVEGYFDVLSLNKLGYANSASPSGTALTYQQLESVSKYTSKILICFDNDEAGLKATERVLEIKNQISKQVEIHCLNLPSEFKDISDVFESKPELFDDILKDNDEIVEYLLNKFLKKESNKKSVFNYFRKITAKLSPLEVDIALDLLSAKLNTEKEILKRELNFQTEEEFEQVGETSLNSVSIFQDIVTANIVQNNFEISENEKEILSLNSDYANLISSLESDKNKSKEYQNISFLPDQYEEAVVRLYLYFANFKIETLINRFEQQEKKDFSLLQQVEDLKKKKEIYQNTI